MLKFLTLSAILASAAPFPIQVYAQETPAVAASDEHFDAAATTAAIEKLAGLGVLSETNYWIENARPGASCTGAMVGDFIIAGARKLTSPDSVTDLSSAVDVLIREKVIANANAETLWKRNAQEGKRCSGKFVAALLQQLAEKL